MTATNDKVDQSGADEREKFEAWYAEKYQGDASTFTRFDFGIMEYRCAYIQQSWLAWSARAALQAQPSATANPNVIQDRNAHNDLLTYVLQDDVHNRLIPRVIDIAYTAFMCAKQPNNEDGGTSDWFNDTKPVITKAIDKLRKDLLAATPANMPASDAEFLSIDDYALWSKFVGLRELQIEDVPLPDLIPRIRAILAPQQPVAASYPECSGDSSSCPENEGHGCCKPNPVQAKALTDVIARLNKALSEPFPREEIDLDDVRALLASQPSAQTAEELAALKSKIIEYGKQRFRMGSAGKQNADAIRNMMKSEQTFKEIESDLSALFASKPSAQADVAAVRDAALEEVLTALGDLSFECFSDIGTQRPSVETYNRTFSVLEKYRALKSAAPTKAVRWDLFPGWLIDHCEGQIISEEGLQMALSDMLAAAPTAQPQEKDGL